MGIRSERVGSEFEKELNELITTLNDPMIDSFVIVTKVLVSDDLKNAKVFVSLSGEESKFENTMKGLKHSSNYLRSKLAERYSHMKTVPKLTFERDLRQEYMDKVDQLLKGYYDENKDK